MSAKIIINFITFRIVLFTGIIIMHFLLSYKMLELLLNHVISNTFSIIVNGLIIIMVIIISAIIIIIMVLISHHAIDGIIVQDET